MKTLITATVIAIATSATLASANQTANFTGNSGAEPVGCVFLAANNGVMAREENTWETTTRASFNLRARGALTSISVSSDNVLRDVNGDDTGVVATVNYTQDNGGLRSGAIAPVGTVAVTAGSIAVNNIPANGQSNLFQMFVGGSITMSKEDGSVAKYDLANNTNYSVNHTVACTQ